MKNTNTISSKAVNNSFTIIFDVFPAFWRGCHLFGRSIAEFISDLLPPFRLHFFRRELDKKLLQFFLWKQNIQIINLELGIFRHLANWFDYNSERQGVTLNQLTRFLIFFCITSFAVYDWLFYFHVPVENCNIAPLVSKDFLPTSHIMHKAWIFSKWFMLMRLFVS